MSNGDWNLADHIYQQGLDLAKEEAAEAKLAEREKAQAAKYSEVKEARRIEREKRDANWWNQKFEEVEKAEKLREEGLGRVIGMDLAAPDGDRSVLTVGGNSIMEGRIIGRFPPAMRIDDAGERALASLGGDQPFTVPADQLRDMVQLLRDKEGQLGKQATYLRELISERDLCAEALGKEFRRSCAANHNFIQAMRVISLMCPLVEKLAAETNSRSEFDACKAALEVYANLGKEMDTHDQGPAAACPDAVGHAPVRHLADCQDERPQGVAGGEPPRPTEGQDRAASAVRASNIRQDPNGRRYTRRYPGIGGAVPAGVVMYCDENNWAYFKEYLTPPK